jgi:hypothetical protein
MRKHRNHMNELLAKIPGLKDVMKGVQAFEDITDGVWDYSTTVLGKLKGKLKVNVSNFSLKMNGKSLGGGIGLSIEWRY